MPTNVGTEIKARCTGCAREITLRQPLQQNEWVVCACDRIMRVAVSLEDVPDMNDTPDSSNWADQIRSACSS